MLFFERADWEEQAVLINPSFKRASIHSNNIEEFRLLCLSAGVKIVDVVDVVRDAPDPKFFIGQGKAEEIVDLLAVHGPSVLLVNDDLSPAQLRNLEAKCDTRVVDRTGVILDIFAQRAKTYEGKLQVELAQLQHLSSRLVRGWSHLERQKGGIGLRGPGETQLEADRRMVRNQIENIRKRLEKVRRQRAQSRRSRVRTGVPSISFIGYTNAGKSTLFNQLTTSEVLAKDQLFSTLDPSIRNLHIPALGQLFVSDTVGFVENLPHTLVDAFRATLEETLLADLLVVVTDASEPKAQQVEKLNAVNHVLDEVGAKDIPRLLVGNKIDQTHLQPRIEYDQDGNPVKIWLSAKANLGIDLLRKSLAELLIANHVEKRVRLKAKESALRAYLYEKGWVVAEACDEDGQVYLKLSGNERQIDTALKQFRQAEQ